MAQPAQQELHQEQQQEQHRQQEQQPTFTAASQQQPQVLHPGHTDGLVIDIAAPGATYANLVTPVYCSDSASSSAASAAAVFDEPAGGGLEGRVRQLMRQQQAGPSGANMKGGLSRASSPGAHSPRAGADSPRAPGMLAGVLGRLRHTFSSDGGDGHHGVASSAAGRRGTGGSTCGAGQTGSTSSAAVAAPGVLVAGDAAEAPCLY